MNKLFKKSVAVLASMGVLATTVNVTALGAGTVSEEFTAAYNWAYSSGVTTMNSEEAFMPFGNMTREQVAKMAYNGLNSVSCVSLTKSRVYNNSFSDLSSADTTLQDWIVTSYEHGLVNGWDGAYHPFETVTRAQFMTMIGRALYGKLDEGAQYWKNYYTLLHEQNIFTIENAMAPVKRYEAALVLYRINKKCMDGELDLEDLDKLVCELVGNCENNNDNTNNNDVVVRGDVTVSLSSKTAPRQYVAANQKGVKVFAIDVKAGNEDATLSNVKLHLEGVVDRNQIKELFLMDADGNELDSRGITSKSEVDFRISSSKFKVPAKSTKTLYVVADLQPIRVDDGKVAKNNYTGSVKDGVFSFSIDANDVQGAASVGGIFPIFSNDVVILANKSATEVVISGGSVSENTVKANGKAVELADFKLKNEKQKELTLHGITLTSLAKGYNDYLDGVIDNVKIFVDNKDVTNKVVINKDELTITTTNYSFDDKSVNVRIEGEVVGGREKDKFSLALEESTDLAISERRSGSSVSVSFSPNDGSTDYYVVAKHMIGQVDNRIQLASDSPKNQYIAKGAEDVTILKSNLNLKKEADIQKITVNFEPADFDGFDGVALIIDGYEVDYVSNFTATQVFDVDTTYAAGSHAVEVRVDVKDENVAAGKKIAAKIDGKLITGKYENNRDRVSVNGVAQGGTMEVKAAGAVITPKSVSTKKDVVAGTTTVDALAFTVQAFTVEDITIDSFNILLSGKALSGESHSFDLVAMAGDKNDSASLYNNSTKASFTNLDWKVEAGKSLTVLVKANFPSSLRTEANKNDLTLTLSGVKLEDEDNDAITITGVSYTVSKLYNVVGNATIDATANASEDENAKVVADEMNQDVAKMNLKVKNDDVLVRRMAFQVTGDIADLNTFVDSFDLYVGNDKLATAGIQKVDDKQYVEFVLANEKKLSKDATTTFVVKANATDFSSSDAAASAESGFNLSLLATGVNKTTIETKIVAANAVTSENVTVTANYVSKKNSVRAASLVANAAAKTSNTLITNSTAYEFTLTAKGDDVVLTGGKFAITRTDVTLGDLVLYMGNTRVATVDPTDGTITMLQDANALIAKGYTQKFELKFTTVEPGTTAPTPSVKIYLSDSNNTLEWTTGSSNVKYTKKEDVSGLPTGIWSVQ